MSSPGLCMLQEEEGLVKELDEIGGAFEEMQEQNARLLSQLKEKDDENFRLMSTRLKEQSKHAAMEDVGRAHEARQAALTDKLAAQADVLRRTEETFKQCQEQLVRLPSLLSPRISFDTLFCSILHAFLAGQDKARVGCDSHRG